MALTYVERKDLRRMMKRVIGGSPKTAAEEFEYRTPLYELHKLQPPVLIIHGLRDENVSIEHAYRLEKDWLRFRNTWKHGTLNTSITISRRL